jgi:cysteine-rich repeat protein
MTFTRPQRTSSAAQTRARHSAFTTRVTLAVLGLLLAASPAAAIVLTGGPTTSPGGGWTCTTPAAGTEKNAGGGNYTCNGTAGAFTNLYVGLNRNTSLPFGNGMDSSSAEPGGTEMFLWNTNGGTFIRYTGQTSIVNYGLVDIRATLTFSNTGAVVSDATTQALTGTNIRGNTGNGTAPGVHSLWRIGSLVSSFTVNVLIEASDAGSGSWQPANVYFNNGGHRKGDGSIEVSRSHVDIAFYTSSCGDSQLDGSEVCDQGAANGSATSCCTSTCGFRTAGQTCRALGGVCDVIETCTGSSGTCPADGFLNSSNTCRPSAGVCDPAENCTGSSATCPGNAFTNSSIICRSSAGVCDPAENCTGSTADCPADAKSVAVCRGAAGVCDIAESCDGVSDDCPADAIEPSSTVCRASGGVCDVAENCDGVGVDCPADAFEPSSLECRGAADVCDVAENCTGADAGCPTDSFQSALFVCRGAAGPCDVVETCTGSGASCPADAVEPSTVECRGVAGVCDVAENCDGSNAACPTDAFEPASLECRASAGVCDVAESCTGSQADCPADAFEPSSVVCRADAGQCDVAETCTGSAADCPADALEPNGTSCDDGVTCTIEDVCSSGVCVGDSMTCGDGTVQGSCAEECDDGNNDSGDGCSSNCLVEIGLGCPETPLSGCKTPFVPGKSSLQLTSKADDVKDAIKWKWMAGNPTTLADLGNPTAVTNYQLCVYDQTGLRIEATNPAGGTCAGKPCWKASGSTGYKYNDKALTPDGTQKMSLKAGALAKAKIQLAGRGVNLDMPADLSTLVQPIVVQLSNSNGVCWTTTFSSPAQKHNAEQFKDRAD